MDKLKVGVVGVGHLGSIHARIFNELESVDLVGVFDIDYDRAIEVSRKFSTRAFKTLEELLRNVDAVSCVVPTEKHFEVGYHIIEEGKHLFLEKPMARTLKEAEELNNMAKTKGLKLQIGHVERFNPAFIAVKDYINRPMFAEVHRLSIFNPRGTDVDVILDLMIHDLDIILYFMGESPLKVEAVGVPVITDKIDIANARLEFSNGAIANVTASRVSVKKVRKMRFFQKDAYIAINYLDKSVEMFRKFDDVILPFFPEVDITIEPLKLELELFVKSVLEDKVPPVTGDDGLRALNLAIKVQEEVHRNLKKHSVI